MLSFQEFIREAQECPPNNNPVTASQLKDLENVLDRLWKTLGVDVVFTKHFLERVNDKRNGQQITICELERIFSEVYHKFGKKLVNVSKFKEIEGVLSDVQTHVNLPFAMSWRPEQKEIVLRGQTVMRKKGFVAKDSQYKVP